MCAELKKCGVTVRENKDGMTITGTEQIAGARCQSYGDHRVAMSFAVAGLVAPNEMTIEGCGCINTSFPEFMPKLKKIAQ